jgi:hypothetical protein
MTRDKKINLLIESIEAQLRFFNAMHPEMPLTMSEVVERLQGRHKSKPVLGGPHIPTDQQMTDAFNAR